MIVILSLFEDGRTVHIPATMPDPARCTSNANMEAYARIANGRALEGVHYPDRAISIKQPWAWALAEGLKDCENRSRKMCQPGWYFIHAGQSMDIQGYRSHRAAIEQKTGATLPQLPAERLDIGGVVGAMRVKEWVQTSESPWFAGPWAAVIDAAVKLPFQAGPGLLGVFKWEHESAE